MQSLIKNKFKILVGIVYCSVCLIELLFFLALFFVIVGSMGYLTIKGIFISEISYTLFLLSFLMFFLFLSIRRGKKLVLVLSFLVFFVGASFKCNSLINMNSMQSKMNRQNLMTASKTFNDLANDTTANNQHKSIWFKDHFETELDENWLIQNFSFPENGCEMFDSQVKVESSILTLSVDLNKSFRNKPFKGGEIGLLRPFLYGKFTVRMKNQIVPGTVSSFFLMNEWKSEKWEHKEIDIEFLGKNTSAVQFTVHHFKDGGKKHVSNKYTHLLGFDSSSDFHDYSVVWSPDSISWLVDGKWVHSVKEILLDEEMYIRMNHWATDQSLKNYETRSWLGPIDTHKLPSKAFYDNVTYSKLY